MKLTDPTAPGLVPKIGETVLDASVTMRETVIGRRCEVLKHSSIEYATLGDYSYLGEHCKVADAQIGKFCAIADMVRIGAPNHPMDRPSQHRFTYVPEYYEKDASRDAAFYARRRTARVVLGHDVWVGHAAIILPGVTVGDGAVIAAGAVVSRDVPPYTIVGGVPARQIKERFSREIAAKLIAIAWWDWPEETLFRDIAAFQTGDVEDFCRRFLPGEARDKAKAAAVSHG